MFIVSLTSIIFFIKYVNIKNSIEGRYSMVRKRQSGFTLIELLAVVVVLAIILAIAVPAISNVINGSRKSAFESDAKMVLKAVKYKKLESENFDEKSISKDNINALLGLSNSNYASISINFEDGAYNIRIVGVGKWDGLVACGTDKAIDIVNSVSECGADKTKPVITMSGSSSIIVDLGSTYTDAGATAIDDYDGDLTGSIVMTGSVNTAVEGTYTLTYTVSDVSGNITTATRTVEVLKKTYTYSYTANYQTFTPTKSGTYIVELWGASGSTNVTYPRVGAGAYTKGYIYLVKGETLYIYVGQKGDTSRTWKFNGGGYGGLLTGSNSGGGATDVRLVSGTWDDLTSLRSRIMVVAGGGGAGADYRYTNSGGGGYGGEITGYNGTYYSGHGDISQYGRGGTQTSGGAAGTNMGGGTGTPYAGTFGKGGQNDSTSSSVGAGGGGGGYYGGGAGGATGSAGSGNGAGGGSSFISGYIGCNAIDASGTHTGGSFHYSGKVFTKTSMIAGNASMPTWDGTTTMTGNVGNGYAKITFYSVGSEPIITLNGDTNITVAAGDVYVDAGATANDVDDGDITSKIITTSNVNPNIVGTYQVTYTVTDNDGNTTTNTRTVNVIELIYTFDYTGDYQTFNVIKSGTYTIELWGASGGITATYPTKGAGAYTKGTLSLNAGETVYIYVGQKGDTTRTWKFNGGGYGGLQAGSHSGGGATDIRLTSGVWDDTTSLRSRIMVSAGGGGTGGNGNYSSTGAGSYGGALTGLNGTYYSGHGDVSQYGRGGTQTAGGVAGTNMSGGTGIPYAGSFGKGGQNDSTSSSAGAGGGGGGYYGGGAGGATGSAGSGNGAGGGSSFISGYTGCNAVDASGVHTGSPIHYSGKSFTNSSMIAGNASMPTHDGTSTMIGNVGNGYAKIVYIGQ
jgi:prepilin-type N-terminal cleavage/methylation domain-containing protein